ncbi:hypothetical protein L1987_21305 [Smallanthus sonchifolius]|uniref:Uncharacterized protein n=1 Tax=Smallanthus sonchifolius TaxID=185202 RepID=A0ACB9IUI2_9ASTR|nr:hypothetical protein L1987_21305 [Smallanthus sonchifolius]
MCALLYKDYGTTMAGLRALGYDFDHDDYHRFVHGRLPYEYLKPDPVLKSLLNSLPLRKVIFSNANEAHVAEVLGRLGLEDCFDDVICFETLNTNNQTIDTPVVGDDNNEPVGLPLANPRKMLSSRLLRWRRLTLIKPIRNIQTAKLTGLNTVLAGSSERKDGVDYALESIHIKEAMPELWELVTKSDDVPRSRKLGYP